MAFSTSLSDVVNILISDRILIQDWIKFCDFLKLDVASVEPWKKSYNNSTIPVYELFKNIVETWVSQNGEKATIASLCQELRKNNFIKVADSLDAKFDLLNSQPKSSLWPLWFNMTKLNPNFVGRNAIISTIEEICKTGNKKSIVISGLGGIGKTEVARKFALDFSSKGTVSCTWFNGETNESFLQSIMPLVEKLGISTINESEKPREFLEIAEDLTSIVQKNEISKSWLVIIDNVDDLESGHLLAFLELVYDCPNSVAILTTRNIDIVDETMHHIPLDKFTDEEAVAFVKKTLDIQADDDRTIKDLCDKLENHALAMNQAVAYILQQTVKSIKGRSYGISDYLKEFNSKANELLGFKLSKITNPTATTTFITWDISIQKVRSNYGDDGINADEILKRIAYFKPFDIHIDFVSKTFNPVQFSPITNPDAKKNKSDKITRAILLLKQYSLIKCEDFVISIHRLVQEVIRIKLESLENGLFVMIDLVESIDADIEYYNCTELDQAMSIWTYGSENDKIIQEYSNVPNKISIQLGHLGMYNELKYFSEKTLSKMKEILGESHFDTLKAIENVAWAFYLNGQYSASLETCKHLYEKQKDAFGKEDDATLGTAQRMANVLKVLGKFNEALKLAEEVLQSTINKFPQNQEKILNTKKQIAKITQEIDLNEAIKIYKEVLKWQEKELGQLSPSTLNTKLNIGISYQKQGKYSEAKHILEKVLENMRKVLGEEHTDTLEAMDYLALAVIGLKDYEKALEIHNKILKNAQNRLGSDHPKSLAKKSRIAFIFRKQKKYSEAKEMYQNVLASEKKVLGEEHPDTLDTMNWLALTLDELGEKEKALEMYDAVLNSKEKVHGPEHPSTLETKHGIALIYYKQEKYSEAKERFENVLQSKKKVLGEEHPDTLATMIQFAHSLYEMGEKEKALEIYITHLSSQEKVHGQEHYFTSETKYHIAMIYNEQRKYPEAREMFENLLESTKKVLGEEHPDTLASMSWLALTLKELGENDKALEMFNTLLNFLEKVHCPEHDFTLKIKHIIAKSHFGQKNYLEAKKMYENVLEIEKKVLGEEHPHTLYTVNKLALTLSELWDNKKALEMLNTVLNSKGKVHGPEHPSTLTTKYDIAMIYYKQTNYSEAKEMFENVLESRRKVLGEEHPQTLDTMLELNSTLRKLEEQESCENAENANPFKPLKK